MTDARRWARVTAVFHEALEREEPARAAYLEAACAGDGPLRAEVESLLASHQAAGRFVEGSPLAALPMSAVEALGLHPRLAPGSQLGSYAIVAPLGAGGMGEVYGARDRTLNRDVAVKVLPDLFAHDPDRLARFRREAQILAALNHPNIVTVHSVEEDRGLHFITMELVKGKTLAALLPRAGFPLERFFDIAIPLADAIAAAHAQGIVHRDLKPANVMVTAEGRVKVLDFGLARPEIDAAPRPVDATTGTMTERGVVIGTHGYMSPEQARGQTVDARSDIFALGIVLYEMLTGRRPFGGDTGTDVVSSIIKDVPPVVSSIRAELPRELARIVRRCLAKDPARRLQSALDLKNEMEDLRRELDSGALHPDVQPFPSAFRRSRALWPTAVVAAVLGAAVIGLIATRPSRERPRLPVAISVLIDGPNFGAPGVHLAVAPNGRTVVFRANHGAEDALYRRDLDRIDPEPIEGTDTGSDVFFSPDGRRLGFERTENSDLWTVPLDGGTPQRLLPNQPLRGGTWGEDDHIVFGRVGSGLWMVSSSGGDPRQLTRTRQGERHELPQILPGGRAVLFTILATNRPAHVAVHILETGEIRELLEGVGAQYVGSGHVVFGRQGKLWAAAFDAGALQVRGEARLVREDVLWSAPGYPQFAVGADVLAYMRAGEASASHGNNVPVLVDRQGNVQPFSFPAANYLLPRLSPTGDRFAALVGAARELWTYDLRRGTSTNLTSDRIAGWSAPAWTPDAARVIFTTWFDGEVGLAWLPADGSGPVEALVKGIGLRSFESTNPVILPDGSGVIMTGLGPGASSEDLLFVSLKGEKRLQTLFQARGVERSPAIAPNGRFIAYTSDESGRSAVYVRPFPNVAAQKWTVATNVVGHAVWTRGGSELVYRDRGRTMAVTMKSNGNGQVDFSKPEPIFTREPVVVGPDIDWDVTPDGERFLFLVDQGGLAGSGAQAELIVIQNWTDELKRLVPRDPR